MQRFLEGYCEIELNHQKQVYINYNQMLGQGAYGKVYLGYIRLFQSNQKKQIAIKIMQKAKLRACGSQKYAIRQREILEALDHENIIKFYGHLETYKDYFYYLEFCEGDTLDKLVLQGMKQEKAYRLFKQLVKAMHYFNNKKYLHRDLKPQNLLLTKDKENLKLADFGIARGIQIEMTSDKCTPIYSAPEIIFKNISDYNEKCDVFSAGYILYEMLTGYSLTQGITTMQNLNKFHERGYDHGIKIDGFIPAFWRDLLTIMLQYNPKKRPSFGEILEKMNQYQPSNKSMTIKSNENQKQIENSENYKRVILQFISEKRRQNNYLINLLKMFNENQEKSFLVPKIYKLLFLLYTIPHFCFVTEEGSRLLRQRQLFIPSIGTIGEIENKLTKPDKLQLMDKFKQIIIVLNKGVQQLRTFILRQIIPQLEQYRGVQCEERYILQELRAFNLIDKLSRGQDYLNPNEYWRDFNKCKDNLYRTTAELEILTISDLRIYLLILQTSQLKVLDLQQNARVQRDLDSPQRIKSFEKNQLIQKICKFKDR